jgi:hypothetical protein
MKKLLSNHYNGNSFQRIFKTSLILFILVFSNQIIVAQDYYVEPVRITISPSLSEVITIDGEDSESSWGTEEIVSDPFYATDWDGEADLSGYFKTCWDINHFYFFARVQDDISHGWNGVDGNFWEFDYVWFFFNIDSSLSESVEYLEDATNIAFNRELPDQIEGTLTYDTDRLALDEMDFTVVNNDSFYTVEAAIPWVYLLPGPVEAINPDDIHEWLDKAMGFDVHFIDSDSDDPFVGVRSAHSAWDMDEPNDIDDTTEDNAWNNTSVFGIVSLIGEINQPPVANAGSDQEVTEGDEVTLDGTGSSDPEGESVTYTWLPPAEITLSDIHSATPSFTAPEVNVNTDFTIGLRVNDGVVTSSVDHVSIRVLQINVAPVAHAGADQTVNERELVMLDGSASADFDNDVLTYQWASLQSTGMIGSNTSSPMLVAPEVLEDGSFQYILTVNDGDLSSEPDTMNLFVKSLHDEYDTIVMYDTVYIVETVTNNNTILISLVDDEGNLIAREVEGDLYIALFPNPAEQFINIRSDMLIVEVLMLDIQGNVVKSEIINATETELNLGGLTAGTYILRLNTESGIVNKQIVLE